MTFSSFPELKTERLRLRAATPADAEAIFAVFSDPTVTEYHDLSTFMMMEEAVGVIERRARRFENGQGIRWGIALQSNDVLIGSCGFGAWNREAQSCEIGYELASAHWNQGIMTEALQAILPFAWEQMEVKRIVAEVMLENAASLHLLEKLCFQSEGILREHGFWKGRHHDLMRLSLANDSVRS